MHDDGRIYREKEFHDSRFSECEDGRLAQSKFYSAADIAKQNYLKIIRALACNKRVLEYGCGGESSILGNSNDFISLDAIDISTSAIDLSKRLFVNHPKISNVKFTEMNAEDMTFEDSSFDLVVGSGIIHHLEIEKAYREINRVLAAGGKAVFFEPLGHNLFINIYRRFTPNARTDDEHPLLMSDFRLAKELFGSVKVDYYALSGLVSLPFNSSWAGLPMFTFIDRLLFKFIPFLKRYAWICVITLSVD